MDNFCSKCYNIHIKQKPQLDVLFQQPKMLLFLHIKHICVYSKQLAEILVLKRGLKAKSMAVSKVTAKLEQSYYVGVVSILLNPIVLEIFYLKHDVGTSLIIFIGNPDIHNIHEAFLILS